MLRQARCSNCWSASANANSLGAKLVTSKLINNSVRLEVLALASRVLTGEDFFTEEDCVIAGFDEADRSRLKDHPLIEATRRGNVITMRLRYDFLPPLLIARYLTRTIKSAGDKSDGLPTHALDVMEQYADGTGPMFDHMRSIWSSEPLEAIGQCYRKVGRDRGSCLPCTGLA